MSLKLCVQVALVLFSFTSFCKETIGERPANVNGITTRYFTSSNAFPLNKKECLLQLSPFGVGVHFGLTNRFSVSLSNSLVLMPTAAGLKFRLCGEKARIQWALKAHAGYFSWGEKELTPINTKYAFEGGGNSHAWR